MLHLFLVDLLIVDYELVALRECLYSDLGLLRGFLKLNLSLWWLLLNCIFERLLLMRRVEGIL